MSRTGDGPGTEINPCFLRVQSVAESRHRMNAKLRTLSSRRPCHTQKPLISALASMLALCGAVSVGHAHILGDEAHDHATPRYDFSVKPPTVILLRNHEDFQRVVLLAQAQPKTTAPTKPLASPAPGATGASKIAASFAPFASKVKTHFDSQFFYVESDGLPAHNMMVGISNWQQQVPLPQPYTGNNAWRIPLNPVPSKNPASIKSRFLRGAWNSHLQSAEQSRRSRAGDRRVGSMGRPLRSCR